MPTKFIRQLANDNFCFEILSLSYFYATIIMLLHCQSYSVFFLALHVCIWDHTESSLIQCLIKLRV